MTNPLAKDEADHKKLRKAAKEAEKLRERSKRQREVKPRRAARASTFGNTSSPLNLNRLGPIPSTTSDTLSRVVIRSTDKKYSQHRCYHCGKIRHISRDCVAVESSSKS